MNSLTYANAVVLHAADISMGGMCCRCNAPSSMKEAGYTTDGGEMVRCTMVRGKYCQERHQAAQEISFDVLLFGRER